MRFLFWAAIVLLTLLFIGNHAFSYISDGIPPSFGDSLLDKRGWFYLHIAGGTTALVLGPLQFWKKIRTRYWRFHRIAGKAYIIGSLIAVASLVRILLPWENNCTACKLSQAVVATLWLGCTGAAWFTIQRRNIVAHKQFMARSYLFAFYFVLVRCIDFLGQTVFSGVEKNGAWYANTDWLAWVIPFLLLEMYQSWWPAAKTSYLPTTPKQAAG